MHVSLEGSSLSDGTKLSDLLLDACKELGGANACEDAHETTSYAALGMRARVTAEELHRAALRPDEPVLVPVSNQASDIATFTAIWQAGGVAVPVHRSTPAAALELTRARTKARLLADASAQPPVRQIAEAVPPTRPILAGAALVIFTSGSTGQPKGVVLSHRAFIGKLHAIDSVLRFSRRTRSLLVLQINFSFGIWVSLLTLMKGGVLLMHPRFDGEAILRALASQGATDAAFVPTMLRQLLRVDRSTVFPPSKSALHRIITGGEPLGRELSRQISASFPRTGIADVYGLTETCTSDFILMPDEQRSHGGCIGRPTPGVSFRIADDQGRDVSMNEIGELQIHTPFVMNGYLDQPELTDAAFCREFLRTGDLARLRPDGMVELVGRSKDVIIRGGTKVSPLELDELLASHPAVAAALTVGVPDPVMGERIHALIVPRGHEKLDESALSRWVSERVEKFKRPDAYHFGSSLPTGRTGKVDRGALREQIGRRPGSA
jgi:long-chain acyl-CoA synthetase